MRSSMIFTRNLLRK